MLRECVNKSVQSREQLLLCAYVDTSNKCTEHKFNYSSLQIIIYVLAKKKKKYLC